MAQHLKQFAASAIASQPKVFLRARLKLTAIYVLIVAVIIIGFSFALYRNLANSLSDASDEDFTSAEFHQHFIQSTLENVNKEILLIDLIILFTAAGASYIVAGYTLRPIQQSMEVQRKFSENASHELRTPLAVMKNDIEVLLRNLNPSKQETQNVLRSNIEEIDNMTTMTEDLLLLAQAENRIARAMEKINIDNVVKAISEKMKPIGKQKLVELNMKSNGPVMILGDNAKLERIITNLLKNSVEHTPARGMIKVEVKTEEKYAIITITDEGKGISRKDLPHIFNRFYKGEGTSGSGLGLSIVKELVEEHRGTVRIQSEKDKGTTVTLRFPLA